MSALVGLGPSLGTHDPSNVGVDDTLEVHALSEKVEKVTAPLQTVTIKYSVPALSVTGKHWPTVA